MRPASMQLSVFFARLVEKHRKAKGLSKAALAEKAGLHQTYIGLLEKGARSPSLDTAAAIAQSLDLTLSALVIEAEDLARTKRRQ